MTETRDKAREVLRQIVHDAILHFDDSQRGYNSAADALEGKYEEFSLAFRCAAMARNHALDEAVKVARGLQVSPDDYGAAYRRGAADEIATSIEALKDKK